jgi:hypothetical protein
MPPKRAAPRAAHQDPARQIEEMQRRLDEAFVYLQVLFQLVVTLCQALQELRGPQPRGPLPRGGRRSHPYQ